MVGCEFPIRYVICLRMSILVELWVSCDSWKFVEYFFIVFLLTECCLVFIFLINFKQFHFAV